MELVVVKEKESEIRPLTRDGERVAPEEFRITTNPVMIRSPVAQSIRHH